MNLFNRDKDLCAELVGLHGQQPKLLRMSILDKQSDIHQLANRTSSTDEDEHLHQHKN